MRILGLDLGTTSVKAVEIDSAFGRYEIREYHERKVPEGGDPVDAARTLLASLPKAPDRVVTAMRTSQVTFRNLSLPVRDKKSIQAAVSFELDDDLPFPLESATYDYTVLSQNAQGSQIHVSASLKRYVETALNRWNQAGIDPDLITTEAWAYRCFLNRTLSPVEQERPVLVLDIGHERTVLYIHHQKAPVMIREINWGGRELTTAICRKYGIPMDQADQTKIDHGFVVAPSQRAQATPEQNEFSDALAESLQELMKSIRQANLSCKSATQDSFSLILLAGGTGLLPGLAASIEEEFQVHTRTIQALSAVAPSGVTYSEATDMTFLLASSLALCLVGTERNLSINFRRGLMAKSGKGSDFSAAALKGPLSAVAAILVCLYASLWVQGSVYKSRIEDGNKQLERSIKNFFGQVSPSAVRNYMSSTSALKTAVNKELKKQRELARLFGPNLHSPLDFLKDLSASIPKTTVVDLVQFQVGAAPGANYSPTDAGTASLSVILGDSKSGESFSSTLTSKLSGIQRSQPEEVAYPDPQTRRERVKFSGKRSEAANGK